ncbi:MAG: hypothetical protein ACYCQI_06090 [Gammaproteobacteria bacterium]
MAGSQKQFDTDIKEAEKITAPLGVVNTMLGYEGSDPVSGDAGVPLVSTLFNSIKTHKVVRLRTLLTAIVSGDPVKAKGILEIDPSLLRETLEEKDFVTAPTGHKFNLKPYQAALCVDDTQMADMIKPYFAKLGDAKEADRQFDEQCPKGWERAEEKKWEPIYKQHDKLAFAIRDRKDGDLTSSGAPHYVVTIKERSLVERELHEFWRLLDATRDEVITAGKRPFNPNLFLRAAQMYDNHYADYFGNDRRDPRALLFWQQVIGYDGIQRIMPVNYMQALLQDFLEYMAEKIKNNKPQARATCFQTYVGEWLVVDFYPLQVRGSFAFNFAVYGGRIVQRCQSRGRGHIGQHAGFKSLCQSKAAGLTDLRRPRQDDRPKPTRSSCAIM